jgi:hypothetical protein
VSIGGGAGTSRLRAAETGALDDAGVRGVDRDAGPVQAAGERVSAHRVHALGAAIGEERPQFGGLAQALGMGEGQVVQVDRPASGRHRVGGHDDQPGPVQGRRERAQQQVRRQVVDDQDNRQPFPDQPAGCRLADPVGGAGHDRTRHCSSGCSSRSIWSSRADPAADAGGRGPAEPGTGGASSASITASRTVAESPALSGSSGSRLMAEVTPCRAAARARVACRGVTPGRSAPRRASKAKPLRSALGGGWRRVGLSRRPHEPVEGGVGEGESHVRVPALADIGRRIARLAQGALLGQVSLTSAGSLAVPGDAQPARGDLRIRCRGSACPPGRKAR